ncbi:helix-turn-helix domain-containing protein [Streptomyces sp. NPDC058240]|uniref:helix-turn-helix domain-containing protein n=1 Tax=Streptomyces sp. NPDC058240 TaxID=3346396 RepID=UPI0036EDCC56
MLGRGGRGTQAAPRRPRGVPQPGSGAASAHDGSAVHRTPGGGRPLRIRATPTGTARARRDEKKTRQPLGLDDILRAPAVREWAAQQLRPLTEPDTPRSTTDRRDTLRAWLRCEAQLTPTAEVLGISVPGVRKRLTRLESVLGRSLLQAPSARYDLWLAFRALDVTGADTAR